MFSLNIYSTSIDTDLGEILLFADVKGLTGVVLPGTDRKELSSWYPAEQHHPILTKAGRQIREYLRGARKTFTLPLSLAGTSFQLQVWDIIRQIPYGETKSYGDIARMLGNSNKARAVGGAANANPLPLVIPCHRVIGAKGCLTGFAGGLDMKNKLLSLEGATKIP